MNFIPGVSPKIPAPQHWLNFCYHCHAGVLGKYRCFKNNCDAGNCVRRAGEVPAAAAQQALGRAAQRGDRRLPRHLWPPPAGAGRSQRLPRLRRQPAPPAQHRGPDDQRRVVPQGRQLRSGGWIVFLHS
jgi:hypothetical protein